MKLRYPFLLALIVLFIDQATKVYIKTHFFLGEEHLVMGQWFRLHFIENEGMAYGWKLGGDWGKIALTSFRLVAVFFGTWYITMIVRKKYHPGFILCASLIYAGAIGNLIDSLFYGMIFEGNDVFVQNIALPFWKQGFTGGYAGFLHGKVVDMLYFPIITNATYPAWFPLWGGEPFEFFRPVFNVADASITLGVIIIFLFQKKFFEPTNDEIVDESDSING